MYVHNKKNSHQLFVDILPLTYLHILRSILYVLVAITAIRVRCWRNCPRKNS